MIRQLGLNDSRQQLGVHPFPGELLSPVLVIGGLDRISHFHRGPIVGDVPGAGIFQRSDGQGRVEVVLTRTGLHGAYSFGETPVHGAGKAIRAVAKSGLSSRRPGFRLALGLGSLGLTLGILSRGSLGRKKQSRQTAGDEEFAFHGTPPSLHVCSRLTSFTSSKAGEKLIGSKSRKRCAS